nr:PREDICTED: transmembrane emp24 domain-containing protein 5-like isoform X2 [Haliaeetus albicilla]
MLPSAMQTGILLVAGVFLFVSQVLDGAGLDVDFHLLSPKGETLVFDERKSDGVHTVETEDGDYMFCFDNTFSTISEKVIFFELILDNMGEDGQDQEDWKKYVTGTDLLDMKLEDILVWGFFLLKILSCYLPGIHQQCQSQIKQKCPDSDSAQSI